MCKNQLFLAIEDFPSKFDKIHDGSDIRAGVLKCKQTPFVILGNKILNIVISERSDNCYTISYTVALRSEIKSSSTMITVSSKSDKQPQPAAKFTSYDLLQIPDTIYLYFLSPHNFTLYLWGIFPFTLGGSITCTVIDCCAKCEHHIHWP